MSEHATATGGGDDGFFSSISRGIAAGAEKYLPIWVGTQLGVQSKDQLRQPTYDANAAPRRNNDGLVSTTQGVMQPLPVKNNTWLIVGGVSLLILGAVFIARRA